MAGDRVRAGRTTHRTPPGAAFRCQMPSRHERESATITDSLTTSSPASGGLGASLNGAPRGTRQRPKQAAELANGLTGTPGRPSLAAMRSTLCSGLCDRLFALENVERP